MKAFLTIVLAILTAGALGWVAFDPVSFRHTFLGYSDAEKHQAQLQFDAVLAQNSSSPKHGYELAKTWDDATAQEKIAEADSHYTTDEVLASDSQRAHLEVDRLAYEVCVNAARQETACKTLAGMPAYQTPETRKVCANAAPGPKHVAQCNQLIDDLAQRIEHRDAHANEEWKQ